MGRYRFTFHKSQHSKSELVVFVLFTLMIAFSMKNQVLAKDQQAPPKHLLAKIDVKTPNQNSLKAQAPRQLLDRIVAEVNSHPILDSEINEKVLTGPLINISQYPAKETDPAYNQAMEDLINLKLIQGHAEYLNIEVLESEISKQIDTILERNKINISQLEGFLLQQGKSIETYKNDMKDQLLLMKFKRQVLMPLVKITDNDVRTYYLSKVGGSDGAVKLSLRKIYVSIPENGAAHEVEMKKNQVDKIYREILSGMNFVEAEKKYSELNDAREGKPPVELNLNDLDESLKNQLKGLNEGDISPAFEWNDGLYIFYVEKKMFSETSDYLEQKSQLEHELRQHKIANQLNLWLKNERKQSKIKVHL